MVKLPSKPTNDIDPARQNLLLDFVETYMPLDSQESVEFERIISSDPQYQEVKKMVNVYEQRGIEKGIEQGIEKGKKETLLLLLNKNFGPLSEAQQQAILQIDSMHRLNELLLSIMDANSLAELDL